MHGFENEAARAIGRSKTDQRGNHRAVAVAPQRGPAQTERVDDGERFGGRRIVKVGRERRDP